MMEGNITIRINAPELAYALLDLAAAIRETTGRTEIPKSNAELMAQTKQESNQEFMAAAEDLIKPQTGPSETPQDMQPKPIPNPVNATPSPAIPTAAAPTYDIEMLSKAAAPLMAQGRKAELLNLLAQFNVQALTQLTPDKFGDFATALRGLGATI